MDGEGQFRALVDAACNAVFETMFFTFIKPIDEIPRSGIVPGSGDYIEVSISWQGPWAGRIKLFIPKLMADNITKNFLGLDERKINQEQVLDTAKETINMVVGHLLGKIDPAGAARLQIPEATRLVNFAPTETLEALKKNGLFLFNTDFGLMWLVYAKAGSQENQD